MHSLVCCLFSFKNVSQILVKRKGILIKNVREKEQCQKYQYTKIFRKLVEVSKMLVEVSETLVELVEVLEMLVEMSEMLVDVLKTLVKILEMLVEYRKQNIEIVVEGIELEKYISKSVKKRDVSKNVNIIKKNEMLVRNVPLYLFWTKQ